MSWRKLFGLGQPLERHYVSELDLFLEKFDKEHKEQAYSESRYTEEANMARIAHLRDSASLRPEDKGLGI